DRLAVQLDLDRLRRSAFELERSAAQAKRQRPDAPGVEADLRDVAHAPREGSAVLRPLGKREALGQEWLCLRRSDLDRRLVDVQGGDRKALGEIRDHVRLATAPCSQRGDRQEEDGECDPARNDDHSALVAAWGTRSAGVASAATWSGCCGSSPRARCRAAAMAAHPYAEAWVVLMYLVASKCGKYASRSGPESNATRSTKRRRSR